MRYRAGLIAVAAFFAAAPVAAQPAASADANTGSIPAAAMAAAMTPSPRSKVPPGYLTGKPPVDVLKLLPPPPAPGSAQDIADRTIYATSAAGIDGPAWNAAKRQLNPTSPDFMGQLSCALGTKLSPETTPTAMAMIARAGVDFIVPMDGAKKFYKRPRPFTTDRGAACDPASADGVGAALGYAYPSGHSGIGWLWALVLSDAAPANAAAIRDFGIATGNLRIACRVHWLSDVAYGRVLATAIYQRIAAEPEYQADMARAKAEIAKAPPLVCGG
jgi:acid phosphatase (class A)